MKLTEIPYSITQDEYKQTLYNCQIDSRKCKKYGMPFTSFTGLHFYIDLGDIGTTTNTLSYQVTINCECDLITNNTAVTPAQYILSKNDSGSYGLFELPDIDPACDCFTITIRISGGVNKLFTSELFCTKPCNDVLPISSCYKVQEGQNYDCNGVYYGEGDITDFNGDFDFKYIHTAYLYRPQLFNTGNSITFTPSELTDTNAYATKTNVKTLYIGETMPSYYIQHLQALFMAGAARFEGQDLIVSAYNAVSVNECCDLFKLNVQFSETCEKNLSCNTDCETCAPPVLITSFYDNNGVQGVTIAVPNQVGALTDYELSFDGGITYQAIPANPYNVNFPDPPEQWDLIIKRQCPDSSFVYSGIQSFTTPQVPDPTGYCVEIQSFVDNLGVISYQMTLFNANTSSVPTTAPITMNLQVYNGVDLSLNPITFTFPANSATSNIVTSPVSGFNQYVCSYQNTFAGTITDPKLCSAPECPCGSCLQTFINTAGNINFRLRDCNGFLLAAPSDINIQWYTDNDTTVQNATIPMGTTQSSFYVPSAGYTQIILLNNSGGYAEC